MTDQTNDPNVDEVEDPLAERKRQARKARGRRGQGSDASLNINSMMDMMTIILCFLLKSYGSEPIQITENDDLRLPLSNSELAPEDMLVLTVTKRWVLLENERVTAINEGRIDPSALQSPESSIIPELQSRIEAKLNEQEQWARHSGRQFERVITIVADSQTPYRILTQVMLTSAQGGVQNFKFAIMQREQGSGVRAASTGG
jgi:biopolymer transport protein ExbD